MLNNYGDKLHELNGFGGDISSQRADDLDVLALDYIARLKNPNVLDIATGFGGQALRMSDAGARVTAIDSADHCQCKDKVRFIQQDMRNLTSLDGAPFDVITCQRAIHYLTNAEAIKTLFQWKALANPGCRLYLSASGLHSELGLEYPESSLHARYFELSPAMQLKHGIRGKICLYTEQDMAKLLETARWKIIHIFSSKFGNVKAVAEC